MDKLFTEQIQQFLQLKKPSDEQIIEGAKLLLRLDPSRNRGLYNSAMRRPQSLLAWIRTDLKKYLGIRQRGLEVSQVEHYNKASLKGVEKTLSYIPDSVSLAAEPAPRTGIPELGVRGRRKDHDALPEDIRLLWDKNADRWKQLAKMHYQLAQMVAKPGYAACDGNELCYQMRKLDDSIREDYKRYDSWQPSSAPKKQGKKQADSVDNFTDSMKTIQTARTTVSRGLGRKTQNEETLKNIQEAVNTLISLKQTFKPATVDKLKAIGITIPKN